MICGAKTRSGTPCKKAPLIGGCGNRCLNHGGASLKGELHPRYKHGKCTNEVRQRARESRNNLRLLIEIGNQLGMFSPMPRKRN